MTDTVSVPVVWMPVIELATRFGLNATAVHDPTDGYTRVYVERPGEGTHDWTLERTLITFGRDPQVVARNAIDALKNMAPRLQKKLDELDPAHESVGPVYGVGADGTITALRVERDGTVRLSPDDLETIIRGVLRGMREDPFMPPTFSPVD